MHEGRSKAAWNPSTRTGEFRFTLGKAVSLGGREPREHCACDKGRSCCGARMLSYEREDPAEGEGGVAKREGPFCYAEARAFFEARYPLTTLNARASPDCTCIG